MIIRQHYSSKLKKTTATLERVVPHNPNTGQYVPVVYHVWRSDDPDFVRRFYSGEDAIKTYAEAIEEQELEEKGN